MLLESQKKEILDFARSQVSGNDALHRMEHLEETAREALKLAEGESGDPDVVWAAAMLHDICKSKNGDHGAEGSKLARLFLSSIRISKDITDKACDAIYFHNKDFTDGPIERKILWDADKLPIMRAEGFKERMLPYWTAKLGEKEGVKKSIEEYHFYRSRFHTGTAKNEVESNSAAMQRCINNLPHEE